MGTKRTRNRLFTGAALLTAASAIGAGALVSSGAMAAAGDAAEDTVSISMIQVDDEGNGYECTFDGDDVPGFVVASELPEGVAADSVEAMEEVLAESAIPMAVEGGSVGELPQGAFEVDPNELPSLEGEVVAFGVAVAAAGGEQGEVVEGELPVPADATPLELRDGTEEECAALLEQMADPSEGTGIIGMTGSVETQD